MAKLLIRGTSAAFNALADKSAYNNSIVFLEDTKQIWTNGNYYGLSDEDAAKIAQLRDDLDALKYFGKITGDSGEMVGAAIPGATLPVKGGAGITTAASAQGLTIEHSNTIVEGSIASTTTAATYGGTISIPKITYDANGHITKAETTNVTMPAADTLAEGTANGTVKFNGTDVAVHGLGSAAYENVDFLDDAIADAKKAGTDAEALAETKVASVSGENAISVTTGTAPKVSLKINEGATKGNVVFSQDINGLAANVDIPAAKVEGVVADDNIIALGTDKKLSATLGLVYDSENTEIKLTGIDGAKIASISASEFIKDGMVENVSFDKDTHKLTITFNTDGGKKPIEVDLTSLVDAYDGKNLNLNTVTKAAAYSAPVAGDSVDTAVGKLIKGIEDAKESGVTSFAGETGVLTVDTLGTGNGNVKFIMGADKQLKASVTGLGSAAYTESTAYATSAQGAKADSALQSLSKGADGAYVTTTVGGTDTAKTVGVAVKTQEISSASTTNKGLLEASDAKTYIDGLFEWGEIK